MQNLGSVLSIKAVGPGPTLCIIKSDNLIVHLGNAAEVRKRDKSIHAPGSTAHLCEHSFALRIEGIVIALPISVLYRSLRMDLGQSGDPHI